MEQNVVSKRSNIKLALILGLVAIGFYVGFIYVTWNAA